MAHILPRHSRPSPYGSPYGSKHRGRSRKESMDNPELVVFMDEPVEVLPEPKRKRRKYRRYPRPECSPAKRQALVKRQGSRCGICGAEFPEKDLMVDHSYRTGKTRGLLCRQHNAALGFWKDSPTML